MYDAPLPEKLVTVPFPIVRSEEINPVTVWENVIVSGIGEVAVFVAAELVRVTVGAVVSTTRFFPPASDEALANEGNVSVTLLFELSLRVPPLRANALVDM